MKLRHYDYDGRARFVTFCTHRRLPILTNDIFRTDVIESLRYLRDRERLKLVAYVIMPEHVHLVLVPSERTELGPLIGELKRLSARLILARLRESDGRLLDQLVVARNRIERHVLWQRRCYDHNIRSEPSLWAKVDYCHWNPVTRGLVKKPEQWRWSSCRWYMGLSNVPL